ncbi:MAG: hypothetical protein ACD_18C00026G0026, partial [uncultured bacterium]
MNVIIVLYFSGLMDILGVYFLPF